MNLMEKIGQAVDQEKYQNSSKYEIEPLNTEENTKQTKNKHFL